MIERDDQLQAFLPHLAGASWVAVDTEADSLYTYPERLCLIQISLPGRDTLVDPLALPSLGPLLNTLASHDLLMHGADYDLRLLHRAGRFVPHSVFDTMLAARLAGHREFGLEKLVKSLLGIQLDKGPQRANWSRRPLTERMLAYALNDTRYLHPLAEALRRQLTEQGRLEWHRETCRRLVADSTQPRSDDPDLVWRLGGSDRLDRRGLGILRALYEWRDAEARSSARPPFFILPHETLVRYAALASGAGALDESVLPLRMSSGRRERLLAAIESALALPESALPHRRRHTSRRMTGTQRDRYEQLRQVRDTRALALGLDPSLIASRAGLVALAVGDGKDDPGLMRWQQELLRP